MIVSHPTGNTYSVHTSKRYDYAYAWITVLSQNITFTVRACRDAHIALSKTRENVRADTYEIVIGGWGNSKAVIRRAVQGKPVSEVTIPDLLHCSEFRQFWISWYNGEIVVGQGSLGSNEILRYSNSSPNEISAVAITTGFGIEGDWKLKQNPGNI